MTYLVRKCNVCGTQYPSGFEQLCEVDYEDNWSFWCEQHSKPADTNGCEDCAYFFSGKSYFDPKDLGYALFSQWSEGKRATTSRTVSSWLFERGIESSVAVKLRSLESEDSLTSDQRFSLTVGLLINDGALRWNGEVIDINWFRREHAAGQDLLSGAIPTLAAEIGLGHWLIELRSQWNQLTKEISATPDPETAYRMLFETRGVSGLISALSVATLAPRLHLPATWGSSARIIEGMSRKLGQSEFLFPSAARLKDLFRNICKSLKDGSVIALDNHAWYDATFILAWKYEGVPLLEIAPVYSAFSSHLLAHPDNKTLKALAYGYFRDFCSTAPNYVSTLASVIRQFLTKGTSDEFVFWQRTDSNYGVFAGEESPKYCARGVAIIEDIKPLLKRLPFINRKGAT